MIERRTNSSLDDAKFNTQKIVTLILLIIFAAVTANVLAGTDQAERSTILQTVINLTILAAGYWLGSSKAATDSAAAMGQIARSAQPATAAAVAAATGQPPPQAPEETPARVTTSPTTTGVTP